MSAYKFTVSLKRHRMEMGVITGWITGSYWGGWLTPERFQRATQNSMLFGVFVSEPQGAPERQIGFARVVSDSSANSIITDVYIAADWRRLGAGSRLMQYVVEHPSIARTICILRCNPEHVAFYGRVGFAPLGGGVMQRDPDLKTIKP